MWQALAKPEVAPGGGGQRPARTDAGVRPPLTPKDAYPAAEKPTIHFIGVTTHESSIMRIFPRWAEYLGLGDVVIEGINFQEHNPPDDYRRAVEFIKQDPLSFGAVITRYKLDVLKACIDQFDRLDEFARLMEEIGSISKDNGRLVGHAIDPITGGLALEAFMPERHWEDTEAEALVLGAGGSSTAITWYLLEKRHGANRPSRIVVTDRSRTRLKGIEKFHKKVNADIPLEYCHTPSSEVTDPIIGRLKPGSLVINATGLGKDAPGSPLTDSVEWPHSGIAWDLNYRGDLLFLDQARAQPEGKNLQIEDGWIYFIHGWTRAIAEVFHVEIPTSGPRFDALATIAAETR